AADGRRESPVSVLLDQVLEDRARLEQHQAVVLDRGKLPRRRGLLEGMARRFESHRRELVRNAELLEQPEDADRAGELRVVELDHTSLPKSLAGTPRLRARQEALSTAAPTPPCPPIVRQGA